MAKLTRQEQIEFLEKPENLAKFQLDHGVLRASPADYFADLYEEYEHNNDRPGDALFKCVLNDLGIPYPTETTPSQVRADNRRAKSVQWAAGCDGRSRIGLDILGRLYDMAFKDGQNDARGKA